MGINYILLIKYIYIYYYILLYLIIYYYILYKPPKRKSYDVRLHPWAAKNWLAQRQVASQRRGSTIPNAENSLYRVEVEIGTCTLKLT